MSFDSLDLYTHVSLPPEQYRTLKQSLCEAYDRHRTGLKRLLDMIQPRLRMRIEQRIDGQSANLMLRHLVKEFVDSSNKSLPLDFRILPSLDDDILQLCLTFPDENDPDILLQERGYCVRHVSDRLFNDYWPERPENTKELVCESRSRGFWRFDDEKNVIFLHIASDFQGDQWGLHNRMTDTFERFLDKVTEWPEHTGAIWFNVDHHGFVCPTWLYGDPACPHGIYEEEWPELKEFARKETQKKRAKAKKEDDPFRDDVPF